MLGRRLAQDRLDHPVRVVVAFERRAAGVGRALPGGIDRLALAAGHHPLVVGAASEPDKLATPHLALVDAALAGPALHRDVAVGAPEPAVNESEQLDADLRAIGAYVDREADERRQQWAREAAEAAKLKPEQP